MLKIVSPGYVTDVALRRDTAVRVILCRREMLKIVYPGYVTDVAPHPLGNTSLGASLHVHCECTVDFMRNLPKQLVKINDTL
ncbi:hypothetical protein T07_9109 [Trichinella nelsoni]|uniref:Uncharacterized protein n=1 Tax=Trichinella nelsoni TaxID=6336 RepID=A0A0V0RK56_9BILA|nr:hypothetical protein T07_9109 [Trichinella nelsoni]